MELTERWADGSVGWTPCVAISRHARAENGSVTVRVGMHVVTAMLSARASNGGTSGKKVGSSFQPVGQSRAWRSSRTDVRSFSMS